MISAVGYVIGPDIFDRTAAGSIVWPAAEDFCLVCLSGLAGLGGASSLNRGYKFASETGSRHVCCHCTCQSWSLPGCKHNFELSSKRYSILFSAALWQDGNARCWPPTGAYRSSCCQCLPWCFLWSKYSLSHNQTILSNLRSLSKQSLVLTTLTPSNRSWISDNGNVNDCINESSTQKFDENAQLYKSGKISFAVSGPDDTNQQIFPKNPFHWNQLNLKIWQEY